MTEQEQKHAVEATLDSLFTHRPNSSEKWVILYKDQVVTSRGTFIFFSKQAASMHIRVFIRDLRWNINKRFPDFQYHLDELAFKAIKSECFKVVPFDAISDQQFTDAIRLSYNY